MNDKIIQKITLGLSIALFAASLTQKSFCLENGCSDSLEDFVFGIFGLLIGGACLCWLANPLLILSWLVTKYNLTALIFSSISTVIALSFLLFDEIIMDEAGWPQQIVSYELGYWLWVGSNLTMLGGNSWIFIKRKYAPSAEE